MMTYRAVYPISHDMVTDALVDLEAYLIERTTRAGRHQLGDLEAAVGETSVLDVTGEEYGPEPEVHLYEVKVQFPGVPYRLDLIQYGEHEA